MSLWVIVGKPDVGSPLSWSSECHSSCPINLINSGSDSSVIFCFGSLCSFIIDYHSCMLTTDSHEVVQLSLPIVWISALFLLGEMVDIVISSHCQSIWWNKRTLAACACYWLSTVSCWYEWINYSYYYFCHSCNSSNWFIVRSLKAESISYSFL